MLSNEHRIKQLGPQLPDRKNHTSLCLCLSFPPAQQTESLDVIYGRTANFLRRVTPSLNRLRVLFHCSFFLTDLLTLLPLRIFVHLAEPVKPFFVSAVTYDQL